MSTLEYPRRHAGVLNALCVRLLETRKPKSDNGALARQLLSGLFDACVRTGQDGVLAALAHAHPELDITDPAAFADSATLLPAVRTQLDAIDLDDGGPRNAKPGKLLDCLFAATGVTLADETTDPSIALDDSVRTSAIAALQSVIDIELALPRLRNAIIAHGREHCDERYHVAYDKLAAQLDERGMRIVKQLKLPVDAVHAIERVLVDARNAVIGHAAGTAIDRARDVIAAANPDAAARIDQPISLRLTPRDVAIDRACDPRVPKRPAVAVESILAALTELARWTWRAPERKARPYAANQTFAVGELIEHPKFGLGSVVARQAARIDVEFPDGKHTLVHVRPD